MSTTRRSHGKFTTWKKATHANKRSANIRKAFSKCQPVIPEVNNTDESSFDISLTTAAGSTTTDHTFSNNDSFDNINDILFSGKIKPLDFTRYVVDMKILFDNFICNKCHNALNFIDALGIIPSGLTGHLIVKCSSCFNFVRVAMGKMHKVKSRGPMVFDVNTKVATAMYHIGIGPVQLNNFLSTLNLPSISEKTIQRRCEEVGSCIETIAKESAATHLQREKRLTETAEEGTVSSQHNICKDSNNDNLTTWCGNECGGSKSSETNFDSTGGIAASADGAYQRRGSGRCYNSLSGTASLIGKQTGKIISFTSRMKKCRVCEAAKANKTMPRQHKCMKNWIGSAKAMEPDMVVEMLKDTKQKKAPVQLLIGDDDTTGFHRARAEVSTTIQKLSDRNHIKKNISNQLFKLKSKYKVLSAKSINAIMKSFSYMVSQAKGNKDTIRENLPAVIEHQFGEHSQCGSWCKMTEDASTKHRNLPWGADLRDENLKSELMSLFVSLDSDKLSKMDTSNRNESFNNILRSKAPKDKHYSESSSLSHRLSAAVCQKNEGYSYVSKVHEILGMSPGNATVSVAEIRDKDVCRKQKVSKTKKFKLRRLQLKSERKAETLSVEVREGDTYSSNITGGDKTLDLEVIPGPKIDSEFTETACIGISVDNAATNVYDLETMGLSTGGDKTLDLEIIPGHKIDSETACIAVDNAATIVYDLETTGLSRQSSIIQISAVHKEKRFNQYCTPQQPISPGATAVTGINFDNKTKQMKQHEEEVSHTHPFNALIDFINFISSFDNNVFLIAHNNRNFDSIILFNHLKAYNIWSYFCQFVIGFCDTLPFFRKLYPKFENHKQETLVTRLLNESYAAHNSLADCIYLQKLLDQECKYEYLLNDFVFYPNQLSSQRVQASNNSIEKLVQQKVITKCIAQKILRSGLSYHHLRLAFNRNGIDGLFSLLSEKDSNGKIRVTKCKSVVQNIATYFSAEE